MNEAVNIIITDAVTIAQATTIENATNSGTKSVASITDAAAAIAASSDAVMANAAGAVTATTAATIAQADTIAGFATSVIYHISDVAANIAAGAGLDEAVNITITNDVTATQAKTIDDAGNSGANFYSVSDTFANITMTANNVAVAAATAIKATGNALITDSLHDAISSKTTATGFNALTLTDAATIFAIASVETYVLSNFDNIINLSDKGHTVTGGAGLDIIIGGAGIDTIIGGAGRDTMTGGNGADIFKIGATDSLNTSLDTISDYMAGTDILDLEIAPTSLVASTGSDLSMANDVISTGTTAVTLAINIATAVATQRTIDFNFWKQAGDTIIVKLLGSSVAGNNVTYIVQQQVGGNSDVYIDTRDTVIALIGTSTAPTTLVDVGGV